MAARGGHWWSWVVEKVLGFGWEFGEGERGKNRVFHTEEHIYNLQISLSELVLLSGSPLFALSATIHAKRNSLCTNSRSVQFPLGLELRLARHQNLLYSKSKRSNCGELS